MNRLNDLSWHEIFVTFGLVAFSYLCAYSFEDGWHDYFGISYQLLSIEDLADFGLFAAKFYPVFMFVVLFVCFAAFLWWYRIIGLIIRIATLIYFVVISFGLNVDTTVISPFIYFFVITLSVLIFVRLILESENNPYFLKKINTANQIINKFINKHFPNWPTQSNKEKKGDISILERGRLTLFYFEIILWCTISVNFCYAIGYTSAQNTHTFEICPAEKMKILVSWEDHTAICKEIIKRPDGRYQVTENIQYIDISTRPQGFSTSSKYFKEEILPMKNQKKTEAKNES